MLPTNMCFEMSMKEGQSIGRPPLLEGPNYGYWKAHMKAFLKAIDEKAGSAIEKAWIALTVTNDKGIMTKLIQDKW